MIVDLVAQRNGSTAGLPATDVVGDAQIMRIEGVSQFGMQNIKITLMHKRFHGIGYVGITPHAFIVEEYMVTSVIPPGHIKNPGGTFES